jgi:hypothetical protein
MNTLNWRIRKLDDNNLDIGFFVEADLPDELKANHYPKVELMQEDYGEHNGYTTELRLSDAKLIVSAPKMKEAIIEVLEVLNGKGSPNVEWIKNRLLESIAQHSI